MRPFTHPLTMSDTSEDESFTTARTRASPRRAGGRPPNRGDQEAVVLSLRQQLQLRPSREFYWFPELYGLDRETCPIKESTERTAVRPVWPWYDHYCTRVLGRASCFVEPEGPNTQRFGLALYDTENFEPPESASDEAYDKAHVRNFLLWMAGLPAPRNLLGKCKAFFNAHLRAEFYNRQSAAAHPFPSVGKVCLGNQGFCAEILSASAHQQVARARAEFRCIHSNVEKPITSHETSQMLSHVFEPIPNGEVSKLAPLFRLVFADSYTSQKANVRRGEEHYKQWYNYRYLRLNEVLGDGEGPYLHLNKSDRSKANTDGSADLHGVIPHRDPLLDATAWRGILLLYRILVLKETFPDFQDHEKLWFYSSYPSLTPQDPNADEKFRKEHGGVSSQFYRISPEQYRKSWSSFYRDSKVATGHITKQWRHQSYHDGEDRGGNETLTQKLAGWRHNRRDKETKAQRENYGNNFPLRAGVLFAGGDPNHPELFRLPRYVPVCDALLCQFGPIAPLVQRQKEVADLYNSFSTRQEQCRDAVTTAHEVGMNVLEELRNALRMLASRPVSKTFLAKEDERCIFDQYRSCSTLEPLFAHPAFQHPLWLDLKARVRAAEDAELEAVLSVPAQARNTPLEPVVTQMHTLFRNFGSTMVQELQQTRQLVVQQGLLNSQPTAALVSPTTDSVTLPVQQIIPAVETQPERPTGKRQRRNISNEAVRRAEFPERGHESVPRVLLPNKDRLFNSARQYWRMWKEEFEPLELKYGNAWRKDRPYLVQKPDGKRVLRKPNTKCTWWNERHFIWDCISHYIDTQGMTEEDAVAKAEVLYDSCRRDNGKKKPLLRDLHRVFSAEALSLGIRKVGRPRVDQLAAFERAFPQEEGLLVAPAEPAQFGPDGNVLGPNSSRRLAVEEAMVARTIQQERLQESVARAHQLQRLDDTSNPSGRSSEYTAYDARNRTLFRDWRERVRRASEEQPRRDEERFDPAELVNAGRYVRLPGLHNFTTPLPAGAGTPPERTVRYGAYRPDYTGPRWTQNQADSSAMQPTNETENTNTTGLFEI